MKTIIAALVVAFALMAPSAVAQEDPGELNLLNLSCSVATVKAVREGLTVKWCRRSAEEIVNGNTALTSVDIKIKDYGVFTVTTSFIKSPWSIENWAAELK